MSNQKVSGLIGFKRPRPKPPIRRCPLAIGGDAGGRCLVLEGESEALLSASSRQKQMALPPVGFRSASPPEPHCAVFWETRGTPARING